LCFDCKLGPRPQSFVSMTADRIDYSDTGSRRTSNLHRIQAKPTRPDHDQRFADRQLASDNKRAPWRHHGIHRNCGSLKRDGVREGDCTPNRDGDELGKTAVAIEADAGRVRTQGLLAEAAPPAVAARIKGMNSNSLPFLQRTNILDHLARHLMARNHWQRRVRECSGCNL
jgi:hypothetical protein